MHFIKIVVLITCLISLNFIGFGQELEPSIDKDDLRHIVQILSADSLEGRGTATEGQKKAERFIANSFSELGLEPHYQNSFLEKFKLKKTYWGEVYIETSRGRLNNFEKIVLQGSNFQNVEVEKEIVFGGTGTDEELDQIDVTDRLVLVFVNNLRAYYDINKKLEKRNAFGLMLANPKNGSQFESVKRTLKNFTLAKRVTLLNKVTIDSIRPAGWDTIRFVNSFLIPNSQVKNISGLHIRKLKKLMRLNRIAEAPITTVETKFERINNVLETANVIGIVKGKTKKTIVISAHYDHLGKIDNQFFPGADDNASGVAGLLELAEQFSKSKNLKYNIMFLATSAEEAGLLGSYYHVNSSSFNPENIILNLNLDMIARIDEKHSKGNYLYCIGSGQSKALDDLIEEADQAYNKCTFDYSLSDLKDPMGIFTRSDNYNFYKKGIPSYFFFSGLHSDYHKITDTSNKIDYQNLEYRVKQIAKVIELLQNENLKN
ncbi:M20/M25/M40 family metallo-hydrolase [Marivirga tractuosa]|uniref:M28 family metallopeptidase n=1 Tax=Marivirga tractuosa TaxID=1006 RepID=UPI0035D0CF90